MNLSPPLFLLFLLQLLLVYYITHSSFRENFQSDNSLTPRCKLANNQPFPPFPEPRENTRKDFTNTSIQEYHLTSKLASIPIDPDKLSQ